jgi:gamma-glutamylcyclotransferase (GGCT)/AIG2-like uncharacterized protein YtfP
MTTSLFVYGTLMPSDADSAARDNWSADAVRGRLYDLGPFPALVEVDNPEAGWVEGFARSVSTSELEAFDVYEEVGAGIYRRLETTTRGGRRVWVYEYARPLPPSARGPLDRWRDPLAVR